jgi:hypothetical protein
MDSELATGWGKHCWGILAEVYTVSERLDDAARSSARQVHTTTTLARRATQGQVPVCMHTFVKVVLNAFTHLATVPKSAGRPRAFRG